MEQLHFPVSMEIRIDWSELDLFGHVNNVMFMKYVQAARVNYWERTGMYREFLETKRGPMLASVNCDFRRPLFFPGTVRLLTRMEFVKNTSFGFHHRLFDDQGEMAAEAHDIMVSYDFNKNEKIPFPDDVRKAVEAIEGKTF